MSGWIIAPETGEYRFFFHSDDNGEFYLSTDESMDNTEILCEVTGSANAYLLDDDNLRSAIVSLEEGKKYYFEAFWKEGTGGDNCGLAWRLPSETDAFDTPPDAGSGIPGKHLVSYAPEQFPWYGGAFADGVGAIQRVPGLSTTLSLAATIGVDSLGFTGSDTVFVPTDEAWAALPDGVLDDLQANPDKLTDLLKYHIVNSYVAADNLAEGAHTTVLGKEITVTNEEGGASYGTWYSKSTDTIMINDAKVLDEIYSSTANVIIVDKVLIPPPDEPVAKISELDSNGFELVAGPSDIYDGENLVNGWVNAGGTTNFELKDGYVSLIGAANNGWLQHDNDESVWEKGVADGGSWTAEISIRLAADDGNGIVIWGANGAERHILQINTGNTQAFAGAVLDENDNTDGFHTFRLAFEAQDGLYYMWRDGVLLTPDGLAKQAGTGASRFIVGDCCSSYLMTTVDLAYIRYDTTGAFSPVPGEPAPAVIVWTGANGTDIFDEGNWDLSNSNVTLIDPNVSIDANVVFSNAIVDIPQVSSQQRFQVASDFTITVDNSTISLSGGSNDGIGGPPGSTLPAGPAGPILNVVNGSSLETFFIFQGITMNVDSTSSATLGGGGNPVNISVIDLEPGATLTFTSETIDQFNTEHLSKLTIGGAAAEEGVNFTIESDGNSGSIIKTITAAEAPSLSIVNNGDGTVTVTFEGKLQAAQSVNDPWQDATELLPDWDGTSPLTIPASEAQLYGRAVK
jgi:hypothetical protein